MVKYYGRARQRVGSINTNQLGLKMSGCPSKVGRSGRIDRYISRRSHCGIVFCGWVWYHGIKWKYNHWVNPYTKEVNWRCIPAAPITRALAGGVGRLNAPRFRCAKDCGRHPWWNWTNNPHSSKHVEVSLSSSPTQCKGDRGWGPTGSTPASFGQFWPYLTSSTEGGSGIWAASGWAGSDARKFPSFTPRCFTARCYSALWPGAQNGPSANVNPGLLTISNRLLVKFRGGQHGVFGGAGGHTLLYKKYTGDAWVPYSPTTDSGYVGSANYIVDGRLPAPSTSTGFPLSWSEAYTSETLASPGRLNVWSGCIHTKNYNGPYILAHPYYFYANTASTHGDSTGTPLKPGAPKNAAMPAHHMPPGTIMTNKAKFLGFKIELSTELASFPTGESTGNDEFEIGQFQFPFEDYCADCGPVSYL